MNDSIIVWCSCAWWAIPKAAIDLRKAAFFCGWLPLRETALACFSLRQPAYFVKRHTWHGPVADERITCGQKSQVTMLSLYFCAYGVTRPTIERLSGAHSCNVTGNQYAAVLRHGLEQAQKCDTNQNTVRKEFWRKVQMGTNNLESRFTTLLQTFTGKKLFSVLKA